jgi:hypothetical protein
MGCKVAHALVLLCTNLSLAVLILAGCGSSLAPSTGGTNIAVSGQAITKVRTNGNEIAFLEERLHSIFNDGPQRTLAVASSDGPKIEPYATPAGWSLVDFALHPSGDISLVLTTFTLVRIVRLNALGMVRSDQLFVDDAAAADPYYNYAGGLTNDTSLQPVLMHDAARVVPLGESLGLVLRTGRNAVVAYRLDLGASGVYQLSWRTLVEPGSSILLVGITSGSFDTFGQLQSYVQIYIDADTEGSGMLAVGVLNAPLENFSFQAHSEFFSEPITATDGMLFTRLAASDGHRLGSTVIDTHARTELHGLRATSHGFVLLGRVLTQVRADGGGWDAFAAIVGRDGVQSSYSVVDVNQGDMLLDAAALADGRYLALGVTGYTQNPTGESISETAQPLLAVLNSDGSLAQRIAYPAGPRQNQLTTIAPLNGHWLVGGMNNGPGTHSGDANRDLIMADGFLREGTDLPVSPAD